MSLTGLLTFLRSMTQRGLEFIFSSVYSTCTFRYNILSYEYRPLWCYTLPVPKGTQFTCGRSHADNRTTNYGHYPLYCSTYVLYVRTPDVRVVSFKTKLKKQHVENAFRFLGRASLQSSNKTFIRLLSIILWIDLDQHHHSIGLNDDVDAIPGSLPCSGVGGQHLGSCRGGESYTNHVW